MQLIEIKEKVRNTKMPEAIFNVLWASEVDTVDSDSQEEKTMLVDQMQRAEPDGKLMKVPLTSQTQAYILYQTMPDLINQAYDNEDQKLVKLLQKFQARLHAKLVGGE
jgi:hypothetical protein